MTSTAVPAKPKRKRKGIDPTWPKILVEVHEKTALLDRLRAEADKVAAKVDDLVVEAVDEGERYRDIADAAGGRSVAWVQTVLRRADVQGPRVRVIATRYAAAKRLDAVEAGLAESEFADMMP